MDPASTDRTIDRALAVVAITAALFSVLCLLSGCFVVRALDGDPEKRRPDPGLPELVIPTNSFLLTNAPPIR